MCVIWVGVYCTDLATLLLTVHTRSGLNSSVLLICARDLFSVSRMTNFKYVVLKNF